MTKIVSFTGEAKRLSDEERELIRTTVRRLRGVDMFFSGAAQGVDCFAAKCAIEEHPDAKHVIIYPRWKRGRCPYYQAGVKALRGIADGVGAKLVVKPGPNTARDIPAGYMLRNDVLAVNCTHMVAWPPGRQEVERSGTWATVRRARKLDRPVRIVPLDGGRPRTLR